MKNNLSLSETLLYILVMVLLITALSLLQFMDVSMVDLYYYSAVLLVFGIGIIHVIATYKFSHLTLFAPIKSGLLLSFLIVLLSVVFISVIYYYTALNIRFITFIISFIVPYICYHAYRYFLQIL